MGAKVGQHVKVEARPGVLAMLPLDNRQAPARRAICRLLASGSKYSFVVVVRGDLDYVPAGGRPAELLLKDDMLRPMPRDRSQGGFTVAGFPGLEIRDGETAWRARRWQLPRLATVIRGPDKRPALDLNQALHTGRLLSSGPRVQPIPRGHVPAGLDWPQLSFLDALPDDVARHADRGWWRYHDQHSAYFDSNGERHPIELPDHVRGADGPLHFDADWHLRYQADDLRRFGFNAKGSLEYGLPVDADWYPVAAALSDGLWIELSPGRVVEFGEGLLHMPAEVDSALDRFAWSHFAAGDLVHLEAITDRDTETIAFRLSDWRPGPRGWFGAARALLPISRAASGFELGRGEVRLPWSGRTVPMGEAAWLRPDNTLAVFDGTISVGDVVLVCLGDDGQLEIAGVPELRVAPVTDWADMEWLGDALRRCDRELLFGLGGAMAVTVARVDGDLVHIAPAAAPGLGSRTRRLAGRIQLVIDDVAVIRSGARLLRIPLADLLAGVPAPSRAAVARSLASSRELLWVNRRTNGRWAEPSGGDTAVAHRVTVLLPAGEGMLCRSSADLAMEWLPLAELGWTGDAQAADVLAVARTAGDELIVVPHEQRGVVSFLSSPAGAEVRRRVLSGEVEVVPHKVIGNTTTGHRYLATVGRSPAVLLVDSERDLTLGHAIQVETDADSFGVSAIPTGSARTVLDLSPWLIEVLRETRNGGVRSPAEVAVRVRNRAEHYRRACESGMATTLEERLVMAAFASGSSPDGDAMVREWLAGPGRVLLVGRPVDYDDPAGTTWDVLPSLAATCLLNRSTEPAAHALAVHAAHVLGLLSAGAMHEESLLRHWLLVGGMVEPKGRWSRLARLDLGGRRLFKSSAGAGGDRNDASADDPYVTPSTTTDPHFDGLLTGAQLEQLRLCCSGILSAWREPDHALLATARSLLFATGQDVVVDELWRDLQVTQLARLATLGRALTPGFAHPVSQSRLVPGQIRLLEEIAARILGDGVPLSFRPANRPDLPGRSVEWAVTCIDRIMLSLSPDAPSDESRT